MLKCCLYPKCRKAEMALEQNVGLGKLCAGSSHSAFPVSLVLVNPQYTSSKMVPSWSLCEAGTSNSWCICEQRSMVFPLGAMLWR